MPTEGIKDFLGYLKNKGIRTGVISNISYDPSVVAERINRLLPVWYIEAIDLPYAEDKNILTAKTWSEIERYMEV